MGTKGDIVLSSVGADTTSIISAFGRTLAISDNMIAREDRAASGKLVRDIVATKKKFTLNYSMTDGSTLMNFLNLYNTQSELYLKIYGTLPSTTTYDDATVLMQPIDRERIVLLDTGLWGNVKIVLDEV